MAQIGKERWGQYKKNVLSILCDHPEGLHWKVLFAELDNIMPPNEFENDSYESSGQRRRPYIVRFSTIALVRAGWLIKDKGHWSITQEGREVLQTYKTSDEIQKQSGRLYNEWLRNRPEDEANPAQNSEIEMLVSTEEAEDTAIEIVSQFMRKMESYQFQNLIGALLEGMDYYVSWIAPPGRD